MQEGPNIVRIAALVGERGRAQILTALMAGRALTATELADAAGVTRATVSSHLARLEHARLIVAHSQGRHRYFQIASGEVAQLLESMMGAAHQMRPEQEFGPRDPALRKARLCYDHLAGEMGVLIYDGIEQQRGFDFGTNGLTINEAGWRLLGRLGIDACQVPRTSRPLCRACIDWSERRHHLAGALGAVLMRRLTELRWAKQVKDSRIVRFSTDGERSVRKIFAAA